MDYLTRSKYIEYLGETDNVKDFIKNADCVILPSYREGTSRVLLEAASIGRPLIASNVTGCKEIIDHGVNGYLCQPKNVDDLEAKMVDMIKIGFRARCNMGKKSRIKAEQKFDEKFVIDAYVGKINELV